MNLVQKLPIGLSLACLMFMSSCSKENAQTPEPQMESVNAHSNLRDGGGVIALPQFPVTTSPTGVDVYPNGWQRAIYPGTPDYPGTPSVAVSPTGVSNRTHAFGLANQWIKPLPAIPNAPEANSFVTITTNSSDWFELDKRAGVKTKIKYLKIGQEYSIDFYVATTAVSGPSSGYVKKAIAKIDYPHTAIDIDLTGKKAEWVKKSIVFEALATETTFSLGAVSENNTYAYAHIYVDKNSVKKVL